MEQLIFFGIIIVFSILDSIARSKRAKARKEAGGEVPGEEDGELFGWAQKPPWEDDLPTYDDDPSYDDEVAENGGERRPPRSDYSQPYRGSGSGATRPRGSDTRSEGPQSEGDLAAEILAEITGLAPEKQRPEARPVPVPRQSPPLPAPSRSQGGVAKTDRRYEGTTRAGGVPARGGAPATTVPVRRLPTALPVEHIVHSSHFGYGTDPSERAPSEQDGMDPLAEHLGENAAAIRAQLRSSDTAELRRAFILGEVLGAPVSLRDE